MLLTFEVSQPETPVTSVNARHSANILSKETAAETSSLSKPVMEPRLMQESKRLTRLQWAESLGRTRPLTSMDLRAS